MGKWEALKGKLPVFTGPPSWFYGTDKEWQEKVNGVKKALFGVTSGADANTALLGKMYKERYIAKKKLEAKISALNVELAALKQLLYDGLEDQETTKIELRGGVTIYLQEEPICSMEDRGKIFKWINEQKEKGKDYGYLVTIAWQSMNSTVKDLLAGGHPAPPGIKVWMNSRAMVRGVKGKEKSSAEGAE